MAGLRRDLDRKFTRTIVDARCSTRISTSYIIRPMVKVVGRIVCVSGGRSWRYWIRINAGPAAKLRSASSPISKRLTSAQRHFRSCSCSDHRRRTSAWCVS